MQEQTDIQLMETKFIVQGDLLSSYYRVTHHLFKQGYDAPVFARLPPDIPDRLVDTMENICPVFNDEIHSFRLLELGFSLTEVTHDQSGVYPCVSDTLDNYTLLMDVFEDSWEGLFAFTGDYWCIL